MDLVELSLFGTFRMKSGTRVLADAATDRARALLTFLALEGVQSRTALAALLWPYLPQETAFDHLRKTLYRLRQRLEGSIPAADLLIASRQHVQLDATRFVVDVWRFQTLLTECDQHAHRGLATCDACLARLADAVDLYQEGLLSGFTLDDAPAFDEWLVLRRETLQHQMLLALAELTAAWEARGDFARAHTYCSRTLAIDPLREETQRQCMRLLVRMGQRNQALQQYESLHRLLRQELGIEPDAATVALFEQISHGDVQPPFVAQQVVPATPSHAPLQTAPVQPTNLPSWADVPHTGRVYGRAAELAQMAQWLRAERCQLVAILGIGGMGKTTLAAASANAVAGDFDKVIWRSLLNAPPLGELLRGVLMSLVVQPVVDLPLKLEEQLALLLSELRRQRCLLVLDNLESILQPEGIGQMSPGYEGYLQLVRRLAENRHNSTLLLTSREQLHGMARWEEDLPWVHTLQLEGLDASAGQAILAARGLGGQTTEGKTLVQRYSGHPLALKLVTETIQELFDGNIGAFLGSNVVIFDDIRKVLDEHFARLSELERDILIWLAIEREAIPVPALRDNLLQVATAREVLEAVRALQQRSLLEKSGAGVTLQNVIIEYTTDYLVEKISEEIAQGGRSHTAEAESHTLSALATSFLNRFALIKTQSKEYVRQTQARLILLPLAEQLQRLGTRALQATLRNLLARLRAEIAQAPGYAGGNLLNLVHHLGFDLADYDFSRLSVWQADFRELMFTPINLAHADLSHCVFTLPFALNAIRLSASGEIVVAGVVEKAICLWRTAGGQLHYAFRCQEIDGSSLVSISHDGRWLVSSGSDHAVYLWSAENGALLHTFAGHTARLFALAISPDGRFIASSSDDHTVCIWDVERAQALHTLHEHADVINALAFHPDGRTLAGGGGKQMIWLWDVETGQLSQTFQGHQREIECLTFSSDGKMLVSGAHDGAICIWDIASGERQRTLEGHRQIVRTVLLHSDNRLLASGGADRVVRLWDLQSGELLQTFVGHSNEVKSLSFSTDGTLLASGGADNVVQLWDTYTGHKLNSLKGYADMVRSMSFDPSGKLLASGGADGLVRLWKFDPDAETSCQNSVAQGSVGARGRVVNYLQGHVEEIRMVAFHPKGRLLASGGGDLVVRVWDVESGNAVHLLRGHTNTIKALAFSADGRWLATGGADRAIRLWPITEVPAVHGQVVNGQGGLVLHGHDDEISALAFSPDGRTLVSSSLDHTARLWAIESGRELHVLRGHPYAVASVAFSPTGDFVVTSSYDYSMIAWDVQSGQRSARWRNHTIEALVVAFHPNGKLFASNTVAQSIEIRRVDTGELLHTLAGHTQRILSLEFSPTEPVLASAGWGNVIRLWNTETGAALDCLQSPGPYASMNITGVTGITDAQKAALKALGAYEQGADLVISAGHVSPSREFLGR